MVRAQRRRNFGRPREQIVEEAAAQVENLLFNKPLSDGQNLFQRFNPEHPQSNGIRESPIEKPKPRQNTHRGFFRAAYEGGWGRGTMMRM
jgi:hypothetical protein